MPAGGGGQLGDFFVTLSAQGVEAATAGIDALGYGLAKDEDQAQSLAKAFTEAFEHGVAGASLADRTVTAAGKGVDDVAKKTDKATDAAKKLGKSWAETTNIAKTFTNVFAIGSATILGFVTAGMAGTVEGNRMTLAWQMLSREIAGVFLPVIQKVMDSLFQTVRWFRNLGEGGQNAIMILGGLAVAFGIVGKAAMALYANPVLLGLAGLAAMIGLVSKQLVEAASNAAKFRASLEHNRQGGMSQKSLDRAYQGAGIDKKDSFEEKARKAQERIEELEEAGRKAGLDITTDKRSLSEGLGPNPAKRRLADELRQERAALIGVRDAAREGRDIDPTSDDAKNKHRRPTPASTGFEAITSSYSRIQNAVAKTGMESPEAKATKEVKKEQETSNGWLTEIRNLLLRLNGIVVPQ